MKTNAYAATTSTSPLAPFQLQRRDPGEHDVQIEILFCGVCHSDVHTVRNEWHGTTYPCVPGHEIIGRVVKVGARVRKFNEGDTAGVGCLVDSCRTCASCKEDLEQFCEKGAIFTYNSPDKHSGGLTYGGYSENIVVDEAFVLTVPKNLERAGAKLLEEFARHDPTIRLDDIGLPPGEAATRKAIAATKKQELLSQTGAAFELSLLLTQAQALSYAWHLAKVAAENELQPARARALARLSEDMEKLYHEVIGLMRSRTK